MRKEYKLSELILGGIMMSVFKSGSRNAFDQDRKDPLFSENYTRVFKLKLPSCDAIDDVMRAISTNELEQLKCQVLHSLLAKRVLHKFRFQNQYFMISVDATGIASYSSDYCGECTSKTSKNGNTTYFHHVLEAKLVTTNDMAFSIGTEWIRNSEQGEYDKQDCELNAFKRLAAKLKKEFPRLPILILVDALYANEPFFKICIEHGWEFIVTFKDGNLPSVHQEIDLLPPSARKHAERLIPGANKSFKKQNYTYIDNIDYKGIALSYVKCEEQIQSPNAEDKIKTFTHLSSIKACAKNYERISCSGRLRWVIENSFDYLKNHGYNMKHKYSRVSFTALRNYYQCMMIAHMINQFVEKSKDLQPALKKDSKMTIKYLWKRLCTFFLEVDIDSVEYDHFVRKRNQIRLA